jgi:ABC-type uncharacterized transport system substrate-binding protein
MTRRRVAVVAILPLLGIGAAPNPPTDPHGPPVLVLIRGVPAFEAARRGFIAEARDAIVVELAPDLSDARALLEPVRLRNPPVVVAFGSAAAMAVHEYLPFAPKVFGLILQPRLLAEDTGMRSGYTLAVEPETRIAALDRLFQPLRRIAILTGPDGRAEALGLAAAARSRGVDARILTAAKAENLSGLLKSLDRSTQALLLTTETLFLKEEVTHALIRRTLEAGVPVVGFSEKTVRLGGLAAIEIDYHSHGAGLARAAREAVQAPAPAKPEFSPATEYRWVVNRETAKTLGIAIPDGLTGSADERGGGMR